MTNATTLPHLRSALLAVLAAALLPVGSAAQRQPRLPASGAHLIPSFQAGGLQWSTRSVGAFGGSVQAELGKGAVVGAFGMEAWVPLHARCPSGLPVCESPEYGAGLTGAARWRHPLGGRRGNTLVIGAAAGAYYWQGTAAQLDPDPGFTAGAGIEIGTDFRGTRRRPGMRVLAGLRFLANGATLFSASIGPRIPL